MIKLDRELTRKILFALVLSLFLIKFILLPMNRSLTQQKELYEQYIAQYAQKRQLLERKKEELARYENKTLPGNETYLPSYLYHKDKDPLTIQLNLLKKLLSKLKEHRLELLGFELSPLSYGKNLTEIPINLRFKGKIKNVFDFFRYLEREEKRIFIRDCSISESSRELTVNLVITTLKSEI